MALDMTDVYAALYERFDKFHDVDDAFTLTDGRFYRSQAPVPTVFPCIVIAQIGGSISEMFSLESLDDISLQMSVFAEYRNDTTLASKIMRSLIRIYNWKELTIPSGETFLRMRREGIQQEVVEDRTHIHIFQDWVLEVQVPTWR